MNDYLSGILALAQMTPEQVDMGQQRFETLRGLYGKNGFESSAAMAGSNMVTQGPTSTSGAQEIQDQIGQVYTGEVRDSSGNVVRPAIPTPVGDVFPTSQPTMTPTQGVEGGFGTGPTPYRQPYYQSSFVNRNPYFSGYGMGYNAYMPQFGRVGTYGSRGKGGGYGGGYSGGFGSYGKGGGI